MSLPPYITHKQLKEQNERFKLYKYVVINTFCKINKDRIIKMLNKYIIDYKIKITEVQKKNTMKIS